MTASANDAKRAAVALPYDTVRHAVRPSHLAARQALQCPLELLGLQPGGGGDVAVRQRVGVVEQQQHGGLGGGVQGRARKRGRGGQSGVLKVTITAVTLFCLCVADQQQRGGLEQKGFARVRRLLTLRE